MPESIERISDRVSDLESNMGELITLVKKIEQRDEKRISAISELLSDQKVQTEVMNGIKRSIDALVSSQEAIFKVGLPICGVRGVQIENMASKIIDMEKKLEANEKSHGHIYGYINNRIYWIVGGAFAIGSGLLIYFLTHGGAK